MLILWVIKPPQRSLFLFLASAQEHLTTTVIKQFAMGFLKMGGHNFSC